MADEPQTLAAKVRAKYPGVYDDLSDADLESKVKAKFPGVYDDLPLSGTTKVEVAGKDVTAPLTFGAGFQERLGSAVAAPVTLGKAAYDTSEQHRTDAEAAAKRGDYARAALHLIGSTPQSAIAENLIVKPSKEQFDKAKAAYDKGDYQGTLLHGLAMFPIAGPLLANITENVASGDPRKQGAAVADVVSMVAPEALRLGPSKVRVPGLGGGTARENAAMAFAEKHGIPSDAATSTQNVFAQGLQFLADRTLGGSVVAKRGQQAREAGLERVAGEVAGRVSPTASSPELAGKSIRTGLESEIATQHGAANVAYDRLRTLEQQTPMTVDLSQFKRVMQPIRDRMYRQLPETVRAASGGFRVLEQLLSGPDRIPLSIADSDLSVIKAMAREADPHVRTFGQGIAAKTAGMMDAEVLKAASQGGPDAVAALKEGRAATRAKYAAHEVLGEFADEPVRAFGQATLAHDAGIERLRALHRSNPDALPQIGRAYLDDLAAQATAEGGFKFADRLAANWKKLGPETKKLMFRDPSVIKDMDDLLLFAKRAAENPNPSRTAQQLLIFSELGHLVVNPAAGIPVQLGGAALAKFLRTPGGIRLLRDGVVLPINHPAVRRTIQALEAARVESTPVEQTQ